jgi:hypothetical protein
MIEPPVGAKVAGLHAYPVKSCGGIELERAEVDELGIRHDRRWMIVDGGGRFLSQRTVPLLATIRVALGPERLVLSAPGRPALDLSAIPMMGATEPVSVWRDTVEALSMGEEAEEWLTAFLGFPARLVWMASETRRAAKRDPAGTDPRISFADAYSFLVISRESLDELNARLDVSLPMNRFRPNIVLEGAAPFVEDGWTRVRIGALELDMAGPCARCATTTTDQETGARGVEPLRILATFRRDGAEVMFGQNANHRGPGELRVGMPVEVLGRR